MVVVGAGQMAALAVKHLRQRGVGPVRVLNRSLEHARALAERTNADTRRPRRAPRRARATPTSSSRRPAPRASWSTARPWCATRSARARRPLVRARPRGPAGRRARDGATSTASRLVDIDGLRERLGRARRRATADDIERAHEIVVDEVRRFTVRRRADDLAPLIRALRERGEAASRRARPLPLRLAAARRRTSARPSRRSPAASSRSSCTTRSCELKERSGPAPTDVHARVLAELFGLEPRRRVTLRIGTRRSPLALAQAERGGLPRLGAHGVESRARPDARPPATRAPPRDDLPRGSRVCSDRHDPRRPRTGEIDLAVHSAKDLPAEDDDGFVIGAVPSAPTISTCWSRGTRTPEAGTRVGTSSLRRRAQLLAAFPGVIVDDLRGNVDTRLRKLADGEVDAAVLAAAGLARLGIVPDHAPTARATEMVPAPGQGCLAVQAATTTTGRSRRSRRSTIAPSQPRARGRARADGAARRRLRAPASGAFAAIDGDARSPASRSSPRPTGPLVRARPRPTAPPEEVAGLAAPRPDRRGAPTRSSPGRRAVSGRVDAARRANDPRDTARSSGAAALVELLERRGARRDRRARDRARAGAFGRAHEGACGTWRPAVHAGSRSRATRRSRCSPTAWNRGDVRARVAAVGDGTAEAFRSLGRRDPDLHADGVHDRGARAARSRRGRAACCAPRADIAPEGLEDALAAKGWTPERVDAYRTRMPRSLPAEARAALAGGEVDAVTFTSASTVRGFVGALGVVRGEPEGRLHRPGDRDARHGRTASRCTPSRTRTRSTGWSTPWSARWASDPPLTAACTVAAARYPARMPFPESPPAPDASHARRCAR